MRQTSCEKTEFNAYSKSKMIRIIFQRWELQSMADSNIVFHHLILINCKFKKEENPSHFLKNDSSIEMFKITDDCNQSWFILKNRLWGSLKEVMLRPWKQKKKKKKKPSPKEASLRLVLVQKWSTYLSTCGWSFNRMWTYVSLNKGWSHFWTVSMTSASHSACSSLVFLARSSAGNSK